MIMDLKQSCKKNTGMMYSVAYALAWDKLGQMKACVSLNCADGLKDLQNA